MMARTFQLARRARRRLLGPKKELTDKELAAIVGEAVKCLPQWIEISRRLGSRDPRRRLARSAAHRGRVIEVMRSEYEHAHGLPTGALGPPWRRNGLSRRVPRAQPLMRRWAG